MATPGVLIGVAGVHFLPHGSTTLNIPRKSVYTARREKRDTRSGDLAR